MAEIRVASATDAQGVSRGEAEHWLARLARLGFAVKGIVYIVIGSLAVRAALGRGGETTDSRGALASIDSGSFGDIALGITAIGLLGYAVWQLVSAYKDTEDKGSDAKGVALRIGQVGRAIAYAALGVAAARLLLTSTVGGGDGAERWTTRALEVPMGRWLVIAAGAGVVIYGIYQLYRAAAKEVHKRLELGGVSEGMRNAVEGFGRFGIGARGVVFGLIGWFLVQAGWRYDPNRAGGVEQSLDTLRSSDYGGLALGVIAAGLIAYGLFQLASAKFRRVRIA